MKRFLTYNVGWKLLSLAAAIVLWFSVASEPEVSAFISVRVEYKNLPSLLEISSDVVESVLLEVHGSSEELRGLPEGRRRFAVVLDLSDTESGARTFTIDRTEVRLPRGIQFVHSIPAQIRMSFEPGATRSVPVEIRYAGTLPQDLHVVEATAEPSVLAIVGPASRVAQVAAVQTDPLKLKPEPGINAYRLDAFVNDSRVRFQDSPQVTVKVKVEKN